MSLYSKNIWRKNTKYPVKLFLDYANSTDPTDEDAFEAVMTISQRVWVSKLGRRLGMSLFIPMSTAFQWFETDDEGRRGEPTEYARANITEMVKKWEMEDTPDQRKAAVHAILDAIHDHIDALYALPPWEKFKKMMLEKEQHERKDREPLAVIEGKATLSDGTIHHFEEKIN